MAALDHPRLAGIRTTPARAESVSGLLGYIGPRLEPGDSLLAYDAIALLHFLTGARSALDMSWPGLLPEEELARRLERLESRKAWPRLAVRSLVSTENSTWADVPTSAAVGPTFERIDHWLFKNGYEVVWRNAEFAVLERSAGERSSPVE